MAVIRRALVRVAEWIGRGLEFPPEPFDLVLEADGEPLFDEDDAPQSF